MTDLLATIWEELMAALEPTTWEVGEHEAKERASFGAEDTGGYVCVDCGTEADTRAELAEEPCWEVSE